MRSMVVVMSFAALSWAWAAENETTIRVAVPREVSAAAQARMAGDAQAPMSILILEGLQVGDGEGLTFKVLGPASPSSSTPPPVLAVTGVVGHRQQVPAVPVRKMKLVVPLNERANPLLAGKDEVTLTLQIQNDPGRAPIHVDRAYFSRPNNESQ